MSGIIISDKGRMKNQTIDTDNSVNDCKTYGDNVSINSSALCS